MTRLTFGIPVYNGERYFPSALASIQKQELQDIRIVISDNGSTDATRDLCLAASLEDDRVEYHRSEENRGGVWNYQHLYDLCETELFSWMAADDIKLPTFAGQTIETLDAAGPDTVFSCPRTRIIDGAGRIYESLNDEHMGLDADAAHDRVRALLRAQASHPMYGTIRTDALRKTRGIRASLGSDVVLLVELLCIGKMALSPDESFLLRRHDAQASVQGSAGASWFGNGRRGNHSFAETQTNIELYRGVAHSELPSGEKVRTWGTLGPSWVFPRWRAMARDVANAVGVKPGNGRLQAQRRAQAVASEPDGAPAESE
jgi:glycosyltransferase involved in cell wall biosynthesis